MTDNITAKETTDIMYLLIELQCHLWNGFANKE